MNKVQKLQHSLYETKMKMINLEFRAKSKGLARNEEIEMELLRKRQIQLEEKISKMKS